MSGRLEGKVALVTGATSGSGLGIARRFVKEGAQVVLTARGEERLIETASTLGDNALPVAMNAGIPASVEAAFSQVAANFGKLDILINNAAVYKPCAVDKLSDEEIHAQVATNYLGPVYTCRAAIPLLRAAGGGDIVNTSSESTDHPFPLLSLYVSSKAALEMFSRVLAMEVRSENIRVTTVIQGTAAGPGGGSTDWAWDPEYEREARALWTEMGLMREVYADGGTQDVDDIGEVHVFIVTRPRTQRLDRVWCRSF